MIRSIWFTWRSSSRSMRNSFIRHVCNGQIITWSFSRRSLGFLLFGCFWRYFWWFIGLLILNKTIGKFFMVRFKSLANVPSLLLEAELNSFLIWIKMPNLKSLLFSTFLVTNSCYFDLFIIYLQFNWLLLTFLIIFSRILVFLFVLMRDINSN